MTPDPFVSPEYLYANTPPTGIIKLSDYIQQHADSLGKHYHSELARRMNRVRAYEED